MSYVSCVWESYSKAFRHAWAFSMWLFVLAVVIHYITCMCRFYYSCVWLACMQACQTRDKVRVWGSWMQRSPLRYDQWHDEKKTKNRKKLKGGDGGDLHRVVSNMDDWLRRMNELFVKIKNGINVLKKLFYIPFEFIGLTFSYFCDRVPNVFLFWA